MSYVLQFSPPSWWLVFPTTIYWRDYPSSIVCSLLLCCKLVVHKCIGLSLGFQFCSTDQGICFSVNTMLFWLLWLCNIIWYQGVWYLQICSFFSGLLWLFRVFCGSIQILEFLFYFGEKRPSDFDWNCTESADCFR